MTIAEISKIENDRSKPEQFGVIHLFSESNFYRAHDVSILHKCDYNPSSFHATWRKK